MAASQFKFVTAVSSWWNPANYADAKLAENKLINHYINKDLFNCQINDISIDYNPNINTLDKLYQNNKANNSSQFLHTLSLNIKSNSLLTLQKLSANRIYTLFPYHIQYIDRVKS